MGTSSCNVFLQEYKLLFEGAGSNPGDKTLEDRFFEHEVSEHRDTSWNVPACAICKAQGSSKLVLLWMNEFGARNRMPSMVLSPRSHCNRSEQCERQVWGCWWIFGLLTAKPECNSVGKEDFLQYLRV